MIEYCRVNVDAVARGDLIVHQVPVKEHPCLQRCGVCYEESFMVVDGEVATGRTHKEILERVAADKVAGRCE